MAGELWCACTGGQAGLTGLTGVNWGTGSFSHMLLEAAGQKRGAFVKRLYLLVYNTCTGVHGLYPCTSACTDLHSLYWCTSTCTGIHHLYLLVYINLYRCRWHVLVCITCTGVLMYTGWGVELRVLGWGWGQSWGAGLGVLARSGVQGWGCWDGAGCGAEDAGWEVPVRSGARGGGCGPESRSDPGRGVRAGLPVRCGSRPLRVPAVAVAVPVPPGGAVEPRRRADALSPPGLATEGVYRTVGSNIQVQKLLNAFFGKNELFCAASLSGFRIV